MDWLDAMAQAYRARDPMTADALESAIFDDAKPNVIIGTGLNEMCRTKEQRRKLFGCDFEYWGDLSIDLSTREEQTVSGYTVGGVRATLTNYHPMSSQDVEEAKSSVAYALKGKGSARQKAAEALWLLGSLGGADAPAEPLTIEIRYVAQDNRARVLCFNEQTKVEESDCIIEWPDVRERYESIGATDDRLCDGALIRHIEALSYAEPRAWMLDDTLFYALALEPIQATQDERLAAAFEMLERAPDQAALLEARQKLAFTLMQFASGEPIHAVKRGFGVWEKGSIVYAQFVNTNY